MIGSFIVDFYCHQAKLIVELDGSQHFEDSQHVRDVHRSDYFTSLGHDVLRIPNNEIWENFPGVWEQIDRVVKEKIVPHQAADADSFPQGKP